MRYEYFFWYQTENILFCIEINIDSLVITFEMDIFKNNSLSFRIYV